MTGAEQLSYEALQNKCEIEVGDIVRVLRPAKSGELGWGDKWTPSMYAFVGKTARVTRKFRDGIMCKGIEDGINDGIYDCGWVFPFFVLEKLEKASTQEKYRASLKKWKEIMKRIYNGEKDSYIDKYWKPCGYCEEHEQCSLCPLNQGKPLPYCSSRYYSRPSVASLALQASTFEAFSLAEQLINILIDKMESDIANL